MAASLRDGALSFPFQRHNPEPVSSKYRCGGRISIKSARASTILEQEGKSRGSSDNPSLAARVERSLLGVAQAGESPRARIQYLLDRAARLPRLGDEERVAENRVMGCTAQVWLTASLDDDSSGAAAVHIGADSDAELTRGFCAVLREALDGALAEEIVGLSLDLATMGLSGSSSRSNTWYNVLLALQKRVRHLLARREGKRTFDPFPSLVITADGFKPEGSFAIAQAKYLLPDATKVQLLADYLRKKRIGVVAHFYMDPEVQGVLVAAQKLWPHIHISDSLVMADRAVKMADQGCQAIAVLGVDFMSENARAILDQAGYEKVRVYRMSKERIGCSLAEAAESSSYTDYLENRSVKAPALHVIYINTSLETKARSHSLVPTITCTSSNVVQTVLQAFAEIPDLTVWYGPDSYMGANLAVLFQQLAAMEDDDIAAVHPLHNKRTIASLLPRFHYFQNGSCIVHDMFGKDVVSRVREGYGDAYLTAHFEVPGEMFTLAMEAKRRGMGIVGSTQNILDFIRVRVQEAVERDFDDRLQFVLGTESGMITAIAAAVQHILKGDKSAGKSASIEVEIIFPVSSDAVTTSSTDNSLSSSAFTIVPGVSSGEGCSLSGGCASCPYMKMNSLDALLRVCALAGTHKEDFLSAHEIKHMKRDVGGQSMTQLGCAPILYMRHFQSQNKLPEELKQRIITSA
ncbi:hypothetical protein SELMODRAFT_169053 [Selaginella moellendorffii]|uniref:Quinolinate synthase, chloroplastic n=1 Tax=Selaginella moellendorffii TaxID=88036 RepID=D8R8I8_SELML|nr:quinolinate synthase, chloroplastic [Selaginella moellendorffii]EFJ31704.1 hypothetical protein SELMODRAFT_169053 [Selaginella moellendorffii]|eukprot:XP_002967105.1 quinolinate synthase, chloroplastic [Selaginella moellendorffii]